MRSRSPRAWCGRCLVAWLAVACSIAAGAAPKKPVRGKADGPLPAFAGAEGFGTETTHARGKPVFVVTRLDDAQPPEPGQFRHALAGAQAAGGGYVVFAVAGTIQLKRQAEIPSHTYVAGQSAPGDGVAIVGAPITIGRYRGAGVNDVVLRFVRYRGRAKAGADFVEITRPETRNVVLDHVSVSFFQDGAVDLTHGVRDVTLQWCHFGDAAESGTDEPYHGEPHLVMGGCDRLSLHHNLYTHCHSRVPAGYPDNPGMQIEFVGNVVYNYRKFPTLLSAEGGRGNVVGNVYIPGVNTHGGQRPPIQGGNGFRAFVKDNWSFGGMGHDNNIAQKVQGKEKDQHVLRGKPKAVLGVRATGSEPETAIGEKLEFAAEPFDMPAIACPPAAENVPLVLARFGALPHDGTDRRLQKEVLTGTGEWKLAIPEDGNAYAGQPLPDADADGMPDAWEKKRGRKNLAPNGHDLDPGYENIEVWLDERAAELIAAAAPVKFTPPAAR
jgi:hypothetical protein